jgi:hypothetical protein
MDLVTENGTLDFLEAADFLRALCGTLAIFAA